MSLTGSDANEIGRYAESTSIGVTFKDYMNLGLEAISARLTKLRPRYCDLTVTAAAVATATTSTLGTAGALAYTEVHDGEGWRDPTTNPQRITPTTAGRYLVMVELEWASNATGNRIVQIARNGTVSNSRRGLVIAADDSVGSLQLATELTMNGTTDYVSVTVFQNSGGNLAVTARVVMRYLGPS